MTSALCLKHAYARLTRDLSLALFLHWADIDGTLTQPRKRVTPEMVSFIMKLRERVTVGVVGGSDLAKAQEQLGSDYLEMVDYAFAENGLVAFRNGEE